MHHKIIILFSDRQRWTSAKQAASGETSDDTFREIISHNTERRKIKVKGVKH